MGGDASSENQAKAPKFLSRSWLVALVAAFCVVIPLAGAVAEEVDGWLGVGAWLVAWGVMAIIAGTLTYKYANPFLPTVCGVMIGAAAPRPSDAWVRQLVGEGWGRALNFGISIVAIGIGMALFSALAKRHKATSGG